MAAMLLAATSLKGSFFICSFWASGLPQLQDSKNFFQLERDGNRRCRPSRSSPKVTRPWIMATWPASCETSAPPSPVTGRLRYTEGLRHKCFPRNGSTFQRSQARVRTVAEGLHTEPSVHWLSACCCFSSDCRKCSESITGFSTLRGS